MKLGIFDAGRHYMYVYRESTQSTVVQHLFKIETCALYHSKLEALSVSTSLHTCLYVEQVLHISHLSRGYIVSLIL